MLRSEKIAIPITDVANATQSVYLTRQLVKGKGLSLSDQYTVGTVVSELATNIARYGERGTIHVKLSIWRQSARIEIEAADSGAGIADPEKAFEENYSSGNSLGLGLSMVKRLMDEVTVETGSAPGTRIRAVKIYPLTEVPS